MSLTQAATSTLIELPSVTIGSWQDPITASGPTQLDTRSLAMVGLGDDLYLFGKQQSGLNIYWSEPLSTTTGSPVLLKFTGTTPGTQGPLTAVATSPNQFTLAWAGVPGDPTLWINTYTGSPGNWQGNQINLVIPPGYFIYSGTGPALGVLNGLPYLLWAGGAGDGYFYSLSTSSTPTATSWQTQNKVSNTGPQKSFTTPDLFSALDSTGDSLLLSLWGGPSGTEVIYGTITPTSAAVEGSVPIPAGASGVYAAASAFVPISAGGTAPVAILLWSNGQYQIYAQGQWLSVQSAPNNFKLPSGVAGFSACCLNDTLYVAWASGSSVTVQSATITSTPNS